MMAKRYLKEGAKVFSPAEQKTMIDEGEDDGRVASNLNLLDIADTHYASLEAAFAAEEAQDPFGLF
jgi:hypothetical protein